MLVRNYEKIFELYSYLMSKVDYKDWSEYIFNIHKYCEVKGDKVLDLGAGNGKIAHYLSAKIKDITISDKSFYMLKSAPVDFAKICCDMTKLPFKIKYNFIYSTFDCVNYILSEDELIQFFRGINFVLDDNGVFTFDVSLEKNSLRNAYEFNRNGRYKGMKFEQTSTYNEKTKLHKNRFSLTSPDGSHFEEIHSQKIYDFLTYFDLIDQCGLYVSDCFDAFTFDDANPDSERAQFIVRKNKL